MDDVRAGTPRRRGVMYRRRGTGDRRCSRARASHLVVVRSTLDDARVGRLASRRLRGPGSQAAVRPSRSSPTVARGRSTPRATASRACSRSRTQGRSHGGRRATACSWDDLEVRGVTSEAPSLPPIDVRPARVRLGTSDRARDRLRRARRPHAREALHRRRAGRCARLVARRAIPRRRVPPERARARVRDRPARRAVDLALDERGTRSGAARLLRREARGSPRSRSRPTGGASSGPRSTRAAIRRSTRWISRTARASPTGGAVRADRRRRTCTSRPQGRLMAFDEGSELRGPVGDDRAEPRRVARPALPDSAEPTTVLGWLDRSTVLGGRRRVRRTARSQCRRRSRAT